MNIATSTHEMTYLRSQRSHHRFPEGKPWFSIANRFELGIADVVGRH